MNEGEIEMGMVCAVLFTLSFRDVAADEFLMMTTTPKTVCMNLQEIVVVEDSNPHAPDNVVSWHDIPLGDDVQADY